MAREASQPYGRTVSAARTALSVPYAPPRLSACPYAPLPGSQGFGEPALGAVVSLGATQGDPRTGSGRASVSVSLACDREDPTEGEDRPVRAWRVHLA